MCGEDAAPDRDVAFPPVSGRVRAHDGTVPTARPTTGTPASPRAVPPRPDAQHTGASHPDAHHPRAPHPQAQHPDAQHPQAQQPDGAQPDRATRDRWLRAVRSRDARFDGVFVTCVTSTGIYCRASCPATPPRVDRIRFLPGAAAAQAAGFRACKRCRPDAAPGSPAWDSRADLVARAVRLLADGVVDRDGVPGLAARLGYSARQVERALLAELGAGPLALARAARAQTARVLVETTAVPMADAAFAAGFASVRQFNDTVREVFAETPTEMRRRALHAGSGAPAARPASPPDTPDRGGAGGWQSLSLRLAFRDPLEPSNLFGHLAATAVPGVEEWRDGAYRRTLRLPHGPGILAARPPEPGRAWVPVQLLLADVRDLATAVARTRRLLDLDADPVAVDEVLAADPHLAGVVARAPGRRVPRTVDPGELAVRAVLGQQVSTAAARTHAGRLVAAHGEPLSDPAGALTHLFPSARALTGLDVEALALPRARRRTLVGLVHALADGELDLSPGADPATAREQLLALPGIGPWTADTVLMRGLGDPDVLLAGDLGLRAAARAAGLPDAPRPLAAASQRWRPWRSYAVQYLWATLDHPVNVLPGAPAGAPAGGPASGSAGGPAGHDRTTPAVPVPDRRTHEEVAV